MNDRAASIEAEIREIQRKSDQSCSIHALLRDRYNLYSSLLDYGMVAVSTYLVSMIFVEPTLGLRLTFGFDPQITLGGITIVVFFLSVVQFKSDWKLKAGAHERSFSEFFKVKSDCRALRRNGKQITNPDLERMRARYDLAEELGARIPEAAFLASKAHHKRKVLVSRFLDAHPGAWPLCVRWRLFLRDNFESDLPRNDGEKSGQ